MQKQLTVQLGPSSEFFLHGKSLELQEQFVSTFLEQCFASEKRRLYPPAPTPMTPRLTTGSPEPVILVEGFYGYREIAVEDEASENNESTSSES